MPEPRQPVPTPPQAPRDFADVDSREKAQALLRQGRLEKLHMFPLHLGGRDQPENTCYAPPGIAAAKARVDGTIQILMQDGQATDYSAVPEYKGASFVPARVLIKAWRKGAEVYARSIEIW